jgi:hypothetical protein
LKPWLYRKRKRPGEDIAFVSHAEFDDSELPVSCLNPHKRVKTSESENLERALVLYKSNVSPFEVQRGSDAVGVESMFDVKFDFLQLKKNSPSRFIDPNYCRDIILHSKPPSISSAPHLPTSCESEEEPSSNEDDIMMID